MSAHAKELEPKIQKIQSRLKKLATENHSERLLQIVRRPGFTTPQELELVAALADVMHQHTNMLRRAGDTLVKTADQIGKS